MSLTHEQAMTTTQFVMEGSHGTQACVAVSDIGQRDVTIIYPNNAVHPDWQNMQASAVLMYRALTNQYAVLDKLIELFDAMQGEHSKEVRALELAQNSILTAQRCAIEGVAAVIKSIPKGERA